MIVKNCTHHLNYSPTFNLVMLELDDNIHIFISDDPDDYNLIRVSVSNEPHYSNVSFIEFRSANLWIMLQRVYNLINKVRLENG